MWTQTVTLLLIIFTVNSQLTIKLYSSNTCASSAGSESFFSTTCFSNAGASTKYYCTGTKYGNINYPNNEKCEGTGTTNEIGTVNSCGASSVGHLASCGKNLNTTGVIATALYYGGKTCGGAIYAADYFKSGCHPTSATASVQYSCTNNTLTTRRYTGTSCQNLFQTLVSPACNAFDVYSQKIFCSVVDVAQSSSVSNQICIWFIVLVGLIVLI